MIGLIEQWKNNNLSSKSIETYLKHIGVVINEAYDRRIIGEPFKKKSKWKVKKTSVIVETATTSELLNNIQNIKDIYDYQTFGLVIDVFYAGALQRF